MSEALATNALAERARPRRDFLALNFAFTILLSAFLLFQIQPLISKFILPWFGGSPSVWTTCMLFFQVVLFCGYTYAHLLIRFLAPRRQAQVHGALLCLALVLLRVAPETHWKPIDAHAPALRILALLTVSVGLPYFVLSATGPLLQAWFSRAYPGRSPYRLYALSNFGSLLALVSYPFVFEPAFAAETQARLWSWAFGIFVLFCGVAAFASRRDRGLDLLHAPTTVVPDQPSRRPTWRDRLGWVALPACASLMLLAATNHICQYVAVIPFLWVVPLSLYLASFIIAFDHERWYAPRVYAGLVFVLALSVGCIDQVEDLLDLAHIELGFVSELVLYFAALFCVCVLCHGELSRSRPAPRHLTEFYLLMSAGGALGGLFVSWLAPAVFSTFFEWTLGLGASVALAVSVLARSSSQKPVPLALRLGLAAATLGLFGCIVWSQADDDHPLEVTRNFYGVVSAYEVEREDPDQHHFSLSHGMVVHGRQFAAPAKKRLPVAYYAPDTGVGQVMTSLRARPDLRVGAVGLGVGTLATYAEPGHTLRFYEINPNVERLANRYFSFLADCVGRVETIIGDARLMLEREAAQDFDVLVLDAFSGDAVPAHLLTREAFAVYLRHLRAEGVLAVNITNRHLDLAPVVLGLARHYRLATKRVYTEPDSAGLRYRADWMLLAGDERALDAIQAAAPPAEREARAPRLWTDHHSDLFGILR
jgi:hypothetical protein